jgi:predicted nucleotidyltransferase
MTRAYLLLLNIMDNDDIYIDHKKKRFVLTYNEERIVINREDVKDFITIFMNDKDALLEKLNNN